jgi:membrane-bound lytic murein transglycosylase C
VPTPLRLALLPPTLLLLTSCATPPSRGMVEAVLSGDERRIVKAVAREAAAEVLPPELAQVPALTEALLVLIDQLWPEAEPVIAQPHVYVKYSNAYEARAIVDFDAGWLQVETVATEAPQEKLKDALVATFLTSEDLRVEDIFTDAQPPEGGQPFLYGQVLDHEGQPLRWRWRAERFADRLLATALKTQRIPGAGAKDPTRTLYSVRVALVADHLHLREKAYAESVLASARRYDVPPSLIYAVIEVESAFNPYAVSAAQAYGLMQVVPATAGRDVFEKVKRQPGKPTRDQLFKPDFNIDVGSAYLHLVDDLYLKDISDSASRGFATIAAYNGGVSTALRTFHRDPKRAVAEINRLSSAEVYAALTTRHPFAETRRYLEKVRTAEGKYR